jgi:hypothetical protein
MALAPTTWNSRAELAGNVRNIFLGGFAVGSYLLGSLPKTVEIHRPVWRVYAATGGIALSAQLFKYYAAHRCRLEGGMPRDAD